MRRLRPRRLLNRRVNLSNNKALGEPPEDPLLLFSVLYGAWAATYVAFNGDEDSASWRRNLWRSRKSKVDRSNFMIGHRLMGTSLMLTGNIPQGRVPFNEAFALYDPAKHRTAGDAFWPRHSECQSLSIARWPAGCSVTPKIALADADGRARECARE